MKKAIIVDLDGTLANCEHRLPFIRDKKPKDWGAFHSRVHLDTIIEWCDKMVEAFRCYWKVEIIFISGRAHESLEATNLWLEKNQIIYDQLHVRAPGDFRDDDIVKRELYERHVKGKFDVLFVIDDRKRVVDMWRSEGLVCLQCAEGNY